MPHRVVNSKYFFFLIIDSVIQLDKIFHVSGFVLILRNRLQSKIIHILLRILKRLISIKLSSQSLVIILKPLHVSLISFINLYLIQALHVVNVVLGIVLTDNFRNVLCQYWSVLQFL